MPVWLGAESGTRVVLCALLAVSALVYPGTLPVPDEAAAAGAAHALSRPVGEPLTRVAVIALDPWSGGPLAVLPEHSIVGYADKRHYVK